MKLILLIMATLSTQLCFGYACPERVTFMYLFKTQSLITQKLTDAASLKNSISFCQEELKNFKADAKKSIEDCQVSKNDLSVDQQLIEEVYKDDRDAVMIEEKKFAHGIVEKFKHDLDLFKLCRDYGKGSPLIKAKLVK